MTLFDRVTSLFGTYYSVFSLIRPNNFGCRTFSASLLYSYHSWCEWVLNLCVCVCVCAGNGCRAPNWFLWASIRIWTKRRCWKAGSRTSESLFRWRITAPCSTATKSRATPAATRATATEHKVYTVMHFS